MNNKDKYIIVPPFECVENGCKERSEKCNNCPYCYCTWFPVPKSIFEEQEK